MKSIKTSTQVRHLQQFQSIEEIVAMMKSLTQFMNTTAPVNLTNEFTFALADINQLVSNLESTVENLSSKIGSGNRVVPSMNKKSPKDERSNLVVNSEGILLYANINY